MAVVVMSRAVPGFAVMVLLMVSMVVSQEAKRRQMHQPSREGSFVLKYVVLALRRVSMRWSRDVYKPYCLGFRLGLSV